VPVAIHPPKIMVTTRSQDRAKVYSPVSLNKRKRFDSEDAEDSIVVEVPRRETEDATRHVRHGESEQANQIKHSEDEDDAPEVFSTKMTAQQARVLPNRSIRPRTQKRAKGADYAPGSEQSAANGLPPKSLPAKDQISEPIEPQEQGNGTISDVNTVEYPPAKPEPSPPDQEKVSASSSSSTFRPIPDVSLKDEIPDSEDEDRAPGVTRASELPTGAQPPMVMNSSKDVNPAPTSRQPEAASSMDLQRPATEKISSPMRLESHCASLTEFPPPAMKEHDLSLEFDGSSRIEALVSAVEAPPASETIDFGSTYSSAAEESAVSITQVQQDRTTTTTEVNSLPPTTPTSGIVTPVWRSREEDGTAQHSPVGVGAAGYGPVRFDQPRRMRAPQQGIVSKTPKQTSLQQYRAQLLGRHPRTTNWGSPGSRKIKFVGA
jgi:hypothetical protein